MIKPQVPITFKDSKEVYLTTPKISRFSTLFNYLMENSGVLALDIQKEQIDLAVSKDQFLKFENFIKRILRLEKETEGTYKPNPVFAKKFFGEMEDVHILEYFEIEDYFDCELLYNTILCYIGSLAKGLTREKIFDMYGIKNEELQEKLLEKVEKEMEEKYPEKRVEYVKRELPFINFESDSEI